MSSSQESNGSVSFSANIADMGIPFQVIGNCYAEAFDASDSMTASM